MSETEPLLPPRHHMPWRRLFQYTLTTLLVLTIIIALWFSWWSGYAPVTTNNSVRLQVIHKSTSIIRHAIPLALICGFAAPAGATVYTEIEPNESKATATFVNNLPSGEATSKMT